MIQFILGTELWLHPYLAQTMFRDRTSQFSDRLNWSVKVDQKGFERDQYDDLNPTYVIESDATGKHLGSMRLMPTLKRTMINDHFHSILDNGQIRSSDIWECTRFCVSADAEPAVSAKLFAATGRLMKEIQIQSLVAVFDPLMFRKYRLSGVPPKIIGKGQVADCKVLAGSWEFSHGKLSTLMLRSSLDPTEVESALANSVFAHKLEKVQA